MRKLLAIIIALAMGFVIGYRLMAQNSLLYNIDKEGYATSYIYGTIHMLPQADFTINPSVPGRHHIRCGIVMLPTYWKQASTLGKSKPVWAITAVRPQKFIRMCLK